MKKLILGIGFFLSFLTLLTAKPQEELPSSLLDISKELSILKCSPFPSKYERILLTELRDVRTTTREFKLASQKIAEILVQKVVECLPTKTMDIRTPVSSTTGEILENHIELVSIMRSGDALLGTFVKHFPGSNVSKILIQRDEETALPHFKYMKLSPTISTGNTVIITEPMIATGGTLDMTISLLKERGIREESIVIASIIVAPEGLQLLNTKYPRIQVVTSVLDPYLNEKKYIVPGLGDFGDRYFGTLEKEKE